jgi:hypothetical protein
LAGAPEQFWSAGKEEGSSDDDQVGKVGLEEKGLSFWYFEGEEDGEDIKREFKARLAGAEALLGEELRLDVVEEARRIFTLCGAVVGELDEKLGTEMDVVEAIQRRQRERVGENKDSKAHADDIAMKGRGPEMLLIWLRRPEVTGGLVALGCLAYVALAKLDLVFGW